jgi:hypothetical protein
LDVSHGNTRRWRGWIEGLLSIAYRSRRCFTHTSNQPKVSVIKSWLGSRRRSTGCKIMARIKEEIDRLLKAGFVQLCRYAEWVSNIVPMEKKNTGKI